MKHINIFVLFNLVIAIISSVHAEPLEHQREEAGDNYFYNLIKNSGSANYPYTKTSLNQSVIYSQLASITAFRYKYPGSKLNRTVMTYYRPAYIEGYDIPNRYIYKLLPDESFDCTSRQSAEGISSPQNFENYIAYYIDIPFDLIGGYDFDTHNYIMRIDE